MDEEKYMQIALELAMKGIGKVNPNPLVGAVIVKDGVVIGSGYHERYGEQHAERVALKSCTESTHEAVMYVTLEPCCHDGKTPPCTEAIVASGIKKVFVGCLDPNEKMAGQGVQVLKNAGIEVVVGVLEKACKQINAIFFHYIQHKTPFVLMKYAMTQDGKIATRDGKSKWISSEESRQNVHQTRNHYSAIMVGVNTVIVDNPELTCRMRGGRNPIRIICDSTLRTPFDSKVITTAKQIKTIIATTNTDQKRHQCYTEKGVEVIVTKSKEGHVDLKDLMHILGQKGIDSLLLEGGADLNFSAVKAEIVNKIHCYIAPKVFGGATAKTPIMGEGFAEVYNGIELKISKVSCFGGDVLIESEVAYVYRHH